MDTKAEGLRRMAWRMRVRALKMAFSAGANGAHLGPGLSMMEIAAVLLSDTIKLSPELLRREDRGRFILSKAHAVLAYYTALSECGILMDEELDSFEKSGSDLPGHPIRCERLGVEMPGGSLGMGLPFGVGTALAGKLRGSTCRVFVVLGDGECDEGSVWEAAMAASHYGLDNLCAIIDRNGLQYDGETESTMGLESLAEKWKSFGWNTKIVDGHDVAALQPCFAETPENGRPVAIIAKTIKGKGVSFMENNREWHHRRLSRQEFDLAMLELNTYAEKELKPL